MVKRRTRTLSAAQQMLAIKAAMPMANGTVHKGVLDCVVPIQPTPASQTYKVRIRQHGGRDPDVSVLEPQLNLYPGATALPHVYPGDRLCLYYPGQWRPDSLLSTTILPWTTEWLLHYELWLVTGDWTGGGHESPP